MAAPFKTPRVRGERLETRVTAEQKSLIERASRKIVFRRNV